MSMRAWAVQNPREGVSVVVFAQTRGRAQVLGAQFHDEFFMDVRTKRAPLFDGLTPDGLTPRAYSERGWWVHCCGRGCPVEQVFDDEAVIVGEDVFCSPKCAAASEAPG